jgi:toxin ParE1/3/4
MSNTKLFYQLSADADRDIEAIFDYTEAKFGFGQAVIYASEFEALFTLLLNNPEMGRHRPDIREHLYSLTHKAHIVFYRIMQDHIRIVRVLHGSRDLPRFFS